MQGFLCDAPPEEAGDELALIGQVAGRWRDLT